jgi:CheY-like chemotaxis protein
MDEQQIPDEYEMYEDNDEEEDEAPLALIVEDDKTNQNYLEENLKTIGLDCVIATTVDEAEKAYLDLAAKNITIDVVFLDIYLRDGSLGTQFLRKVREKKWMERAMIIVMSGVDDIEVIKECHQLKCQNFIHKPIKKNQFLNESLKISNFLASLKCPLPK